MNCVFVGKATKNLALTAANHWRSGILAVGDRSAERSLVVDCRAGRAFGMERDGYTVYPVFIEDDSPSPQ